MPTFRNFDSKKIIASFNGIIFSGFASDGDFISISRGDDAFQLIVGAGGDTTRVKNHDKSGVCTVRLMAEAIENGAMTLAYQADQALGLGRGALYIQNINGGEIAFAPEGWIMKLPDITYGKDGAGVREWQIQCAELTMAPAGALT